MGVVAARRYCTGGCARLCCCAILARGPAMGLSGSDRGARQTCQGFASYVLPNVRRAWPELGSHGDVCRHLGFNVKQAIGYLHWQHLG